MNEIKTIAKDVWSFITKWYLLASTLAVAILVWLLDSKGKKIRDLQNDIISMKLGEELHDLDLKAKSDEEEFKRSLDTYNKLKSNSDLFRKPPGDTE